MSAKHRNLAAQELFAMCDNLGITICAFDHTLDEIERVIGGAARNLRFGNPVTGEIRDFIFENSLVASDLFDFRKKIRAIISSDFNILEKLLLQLNYRSQKRISKVNLRPTLSSAIRKQQFTI